MFSDTIFNYLQLQFYEKVVKSHKGRKGERTQVGEGEGEALYVAFSLAAKSEPSAKTKIITAKGTKFQSCGPNDIWLPGILVQLFVLFFLSYSRNYTPKSGNPHLLRNFFGRCKPPPASQKVRQLRPATVSTCHHHLLQCLTACMPWHLDLPFRLFSYVKIGLHHRK